MPAPSDFVLPEPISNSSYPPPRPPKYAKHQVYNDPKVFDKVDKHAIRVAKNSYDSFKEFLWDLVFSYKFNELEKVRAIFRWMVSCDMNTLSFPKPTKDSVEEVIVAFKNLKASYANVLEIICRHAGFYCVTIHGYVKGIDYRPGENFKSKPFNHSWNAVYIQGSWQLIDTHWASRYRCSNTKAKDFFVYQYDDFYFLMEPQQAVYSHLPQDSAWQLLKVPVTIDQFENLPLIKSQFFKCEMELNNQHHGIVHSKDGNLKMSLGFLKPDSFTYKLVTERNVDVFQGVPLRYFVLQETTNEEVNFYFRFPAAGIYYLTVFAQESSDENQPINHEYTFRAACQYQIVADKASKHPFPFPMSCHNLNWGPQWPLITHYNLAPVQENGIIFISSKDNKPSVQTEITFKKMREDVDIVCKLRKNRVDEEDVLDQYIEVIEKSDETTFILHLPEPGEYGLEIFANEPCEEDTFTHICQYLLDFPPPPGYNPKSSVFGSATASSMNAEKSPGNIREMYDYENDAASIGVVPKPYSWTEYLDDSASTLPGQMINMPTDIVEKQRQQHDYTDLEMPDFLPPPPPTNIAAQFDNSESSTSSCLPLDDNRTINTANFPKPIFIGKQSTDGKEALNRDENIPNGKHESKTYSYAPDGSTFTSPFGEQNSEGLIRPSVLQYERSSISEPGGLVHEVSETSGQESTEKVDIFQPNLANKEKGQSSQFTRKLTDYANKNKNFDPKASSAGFDSVLKSGSKLPPQSGIGLTSPGHHPFSSADQQERLDLSSLTLVQSAFGSNDDVTSRQPYMKPLGRGGSPTLSRRTVSPQGRSGDLFSNSEPSSLTQKGYLSDDSKKSSIHSGYGRPKFSSAINQYQIPQPFVSDHDRQKLSKEKTSEIKYGPYTQQSSSSIDPLKYRDMNFVSGGKMPTSDESSTGLGSGYEQGRHAINSNLGSNKSSTNPAWQQSLAHKDDSLALAGGTQPPSIQRTSPYREGLSTLASGTPYDGRYGANTGVVFDKSSANRELPGSLAEKDSQGYSRQGPYGGHNVDISSLPYPQQAGWSHKGVPSDRSDVNYPGLYEGIQRTSPYREGMLTSSSGTPHDMRYGGVTDVAFDKSSANRELAGSIGDKDSQGYSRQWPYGGSGSHKGVSPDRSNVIYPPGSHEGFGKGYNTENYQQPFGSHSHHTDRRNVSDAPTSFVSDSNRVESYSNSMLQSSILLTDDTSRLSDLGYLSGGGNSKYATSQLSINTSRLTPSGLKRPNEIDMTSDQYNNQYEDSSKIMPSPMAKYKPDESTANWTSGPVQKEPPKNFQPTPISFEEEIYKPEVQALPSGASITRIISPEETSKIFQRIDDHAIQISTQHQDSFNQLIWQLIYARNITDELEKVRVIFLWLCTKDLHKMNFDGITKDSPEEILMGLKSGKSTYAQIFLTLCRYAGLHCKLIVGYAKGADYVPGMHFEGRQAEHSWNAVLISGVWRLVDCHWAARRLIGKERKPENVRYELDMFYFLANPSQLIYTHFPHEQDWQLLHHPINIEEFESLAPVKSTFFKYNLDLVTHKNAVINSNAPEFELKIAFPKGVEERLLFTFTLTLNDGAEEYNGMSLLRYGRQEIDYVNYHSNFWIRAPAPGSYKLLLYTKLINPESNYKESGSQNMFGAICEYKIEFVFPIRQTLHPYPPCQTSTYGPNELFKSYPIESCLPRSSIFTDNGIVVIKFRLLQPDTRVMAKLLSTVDKSGVDQLTEKSVLQRLVGNEEAIINVYLPAPGEYGMEIYANNAKQDGSSFYTVWQYFIVSNNASVVKGLPSLPPGYMGPYEPKFTNYGLCTHSHKDPFIVANTNDLCIQLATSRQKPIRIMTQLIHCTNNVSEICTNQVLQQARDSIVSFIVRFPYPGFFKLQIFGLPYTETNENLPGVFNYLLEASQSSTVRTPFPQQFSQWKEGCYLYEPINGVLGIDEMKPDWIRFRMDVPRANGIAVVVNNEWTRLDKDVGGTWVGKVQMKLLWAKFGVDQLSVCANYDALSNDSFVTILKYAIQ